MLVELLGWITAQAVGDGPDINIFTTLTQVGLSGVFLWQWYDATKERKATQKALEELFERLLPVIEEATSTLERVQTGMVKQVEKAERVAPTPFELAVTLNKLELLMGNLDKNLGGKP